MRIAELLKNTVHDFRQAGLPDPETEAAALLAPLLEMKRTQLLLAGEQKVPAEILASVRQAVTRRLRREPLAYILGEQEFWSLPFKVSRDVLIPRPETEILVEKVLQAAESLGGVRGPVLDLGTGSGVIAIVLALELPALWFCGIDVSLAALRVARANALHHKVADRVHFVNSEWFGGMRPGRGFDLVVSNPPYVEQDMLLAPESPGNGLQPEVSMFEPRLALDGGREGLEDINRIAAALPDFLRPGGLFFMEIGAAQERAVREIFEHAGIFEEIVVHRDYAELPRVLQARKRN